MPITQKQVAEHLGLSLVWVTRALNNHPSVPEASQRRIQQAAAELGYHSGSNHGARSLAARRHGKRIKSGIIAVLTQQARFEGSPTQNVPYFVPFINGVEDAASEREIDIFFCSYHSARLPRLVRDEGVDGLICLAAGSEETSGLKLPIVSFGGQGRSGLCLLADDEAGAGLATDHLVELGHREIAFLGFAPAEGFPAPRLRLKGHLDALGRHGIAANRQLLDIDTYHPTIAAGREAMRRILDNGATFTGVACFNDLMAIGAIEAVRAAGREIPEEVSVIGFDDVSTQYSIQPTITSLAFDREHMGRRAVEWICEQLDTPPGSPPESSPAITEIFPTRLVRRGSTMPRPRDSLNPDR